jgi:hypothetical protein
MSKINRDTPTVDLELLTPKEAAAFLRISESWFGQGEDAQGRASRHRDRPQHSLQQGRTSALA